MPLVNARMAVSLEAHTDRQPGSRGEIVRCISKGSGKKQTSNNFYKNNDTFELTRHVSVASRFVSKVKHS